jgi:hypothetical protein
LLLQGLSALEHGDGDHVQQAIQLLEAADGERRHAAMLRVASLSRQGVPSPLADDAQGCVVRLLDTRWHVAAGGEDGEAAYAALLGDDSRCTAFGVDRYVRADAELRLAEYAIEDGDLDRAKAHLVAFRQWMPDPEIGTPIYDRLGIAEDAFVVWPGQ